MIYNLIIYLYVGAVKLAALFSKKVSVMVKGEKDAFTVLQQRIDRQAKYIWFHAASLGEFEQGRPLIEEIRKRYPDYKILQTFFSPSGYEVRKDYKGADVVCYLPLDTPSNARRFVELARPCMVFFVKYEFWKKFFRWYGGEYRSILKCFAHLFVQNQESVELLKKIGITNTTVVGDTRFDRVLEICRQAKELPMVELFRGENLTLVAGSSWAPDEDIFIPYFNTHQNMKLIIAPHVINESHIVEIIRKLERPVVRYSQLTEEKVRQADCLIIDCFGLLSSIYRYGEIAYIGGGFGVGIHNTLEAAVYGMPVIFGPNNQKFMEAQGLKEAKGGFEIHGATDFNELMDKFCTDYGFLDKAGKKAGNYVRNNAGALDKIMKEVKL